MTGQLERIIELQGLKNIPGQQGSKKIIAFTSGKGGAGKTFVSLNLAYLLYKKEKRVLFVDLDLNYANAHILLNIIAKRNLSDYFAGKSLLKNTRIEVENNFHLIPGSSGSGIPENISKSKIDSLFIELKKLSVEYDFIFIDTGQITSSAQLAVLSNSGFITIITTPEPTSVMDAYAVIKMLKQNKMKIRKQVIVNKCSSKEEALTTFNNLNTATTHFLKENLNMLGYINFDSAVRQSVTSQNLLCKEFSSSIVYNQIGKLAGTLSEIVQLANINHSLKTNTAK